MAGLSVGSIPQLYRDLYDLICPSSSGDSKVCKNLWKACTKSASLPDASLEQIWVSCDSTHSGHVSRDGFYRSLALVAVAQQGKDEKSLQNYAENGETCLKQLNLWEGGEPIFCESMLGLAL
jgi:sorting nexin-8